MTDDRAVSVTVNYALNLVVATLLIAGLFTATADLVDDRRTEAIDSELTVVGNRLAADLQSADRLAQAGGADATVRIETSLPNVVAGTSYAIDVNATAGESWIELRASRSEAPVTVPFTNETAVESGSIGGGDVIVVFDDGALEVRS